MLLTTNDKTIKLWKVHEKQAVVDRGACHDVSKSICLIQIRSAAVAAAYAPQCARAQAIRSARRLPV